mmetsp:Transcript_47354/g.108958  ORF Transcript_47354/g.108958 Transcript_47354/m.108958 type:complete len:414 (+) Transcript_47354:1113-2354(+)
MSVFSHDCRYSSSHSTACKSKWLVGSSSSNTSGLMKSARASDTRMRQPPEKEAVVRCWSSSLKPSPHRISAARAGAESDSIAFRRSHTSLSLVALSCSSSPSSSACSSCSSRSSASSAVRSTSVASTHSSTLASPPGTSCSMCSTCRCCGMPSNFLADRCLSRVVLPIPLRPMRPYRRPNAMVTVQSESSSSAPSRISTPCKMMSDVPLRTPCQCSTTGSRVSACIVSSFCIARSFSRRAARLSSLAERFSILRRRNIMSGSSSLISAFVPRDMSDALKLTRTPISILKSALMDFSCAVMASLSLKLIGSAAFGAALAGVEAAAPWRLALAPRMIVLHSSLIAAPSCRLRHSSSSPAIASIMSSSSCPSSSEPSTVPHRYSSTASSTNPARSPRAVTAASLIPSIPRSERRVR